MKLFKLLRWADSVSTIVWRLQRYHDDKWESMLWSKIEGKWLCCYACKVIMPEKKDKEKDPNKIIIWEKKEKPELAEVAFKVDLSKYVSDYKKYWKEVN